MKKFVVFLGFFTFSLITLNAQNYRWPTNTGRYLNSTFGEFRAGHFHAGIDIKTNYTAGHPVYAVANGYIWRIRTSPFGYGKAIYQQLEDGNLAVYAHLDRFEPQLQEFVRAVQEQSGRYTTDQYFEENRFPVQQGDIIAYSGNTGSKFPHLHFELRDAEGKPFNPFLTNLSVPDPTAPEIVSLALVPLTAESCINGSPAIQVCKVRRLKQNHYTLDDTIQVWGAFGVDVKVFDTVQGVPNKYAPYALRLTVDDQPDYAVRYDRFSYFESSYVDLDRDYQLTLAGLGDYNRLWQYDRRFQVPVANSAFTGRLDLKAGYHRLSVEVEDYQGNPAVLEFVVWAGVAPMPDVCETIAEPGVLIVTLGEASVTGLRDYTFSWCDSKGRKIADAFSLSTEIVDDRIVFRLQTRPGAAMLVLDYTVPAGSPQHELYFNVDPSQLPLPTRVEADYIQNPETFLCRLRFDGTPPQPPEFFIHDGTQYLRFPLIQEDSQTYLSSPVDPLLWQRAVFWEVRLGTDSVQVWQQPLQFRLVGPDKQALFSSADSIFFAEFGAGTVYKPQLLAIRSLEPVWVKGGRMVTGIYEIYPYHQPLQNYFKITFLADYDPQVAIYQQSGEKWRFVSNDTTAGDRHWTAIVGTATGFALVRDNTGPVIDNVFPGDGKSYRAEMIVRISGRIQDELAGIRDETAFRVTLDDRLLVVEYNAATDEIRYPLENQLPVGIHRMLIEAVDRAGNCSRWESTFEVLASQ